MDGGAITSAHSCVLRVDERPPSLSTDRDGFVQLVLFGVPCLIEILGAEEMALYFEVEGAREDEEPPAFVVRAARA